MRGARCRDIQREDINRNFIDLIHVERKVQDRFVNDMPNLLFEMEKMLNEQKRYLSGYDYDCVSDDCVKFAEQPSRRPFTDENNHAVDDFLEVDFVEQNNVPVRTRPVKYVTNPDTRMLERQYEDFSIVNEQKFENNEQLYAPEYEMPQYNRAPVIPAIQLPQRPTSAPGTRKTVTSRSNTPSTAKQKRPGTSHSQWKKSTHIKKNLPTHTLKAYAPIKFQPATRTTRPASATITRKEPPKEDPRKKLEKRRAIYRAGIQPIKTVQNDLELSTKNVRIYTPRDLPFTNTRYD